jgi:UDP-N-acetylglucosamine 2-epimerase (non-hydrolysing)
MKVLTILGTRPEIIRLSEVITLLDRLCEHRVAHTGQNFDAQLSGVFFEDLDLRPPDVHLGIRASGFGEQVGAILAAVDELLAKEQPDRVLILGDTNSGLSAIMAARRGIPVYHMEAGNRCFDDRVPEEINRRIIDHSSTVLMPYTHRSMENLRHEGIERDRIFVIGNPILEVLLAHEAKIDASDVRQRFGLEAGGYFVATVHRAENVDDAKRLEQLLTALQDLGGAYDIPVIVSTHPRTRDRIAAFGLEGGDTKVRYIDPLGFIDFVALEKGARAVITDSGTVQEECAIFGIPNVTIRDVTERAETVEAGSNILSGAEPGSVARAMKVALSCPTDWAAPPEYLVRNVSRTVAKIVLGYLGPLGRVRMSSG